MPQPDIDKQMISVAMTREAWEEVLMRYSDSVADRCVGRAEHQVAEKFVLPIKNALREAPPIPIHEAVFGAVDSATDKTNDPRTIDVDAFFEALAESGYRVGPT